MSSARLRACAAIAALAGCEWVGGIDQKTRGSTISDATSGGDGAAAPADAASSSTGRPEASANESGCSDGNRDGFTDRTRFPTIAGCLATWPSQSMRTKPMGVRCGDLIGECPTAADACAAGWHVCMKNGRPADLTQRLSVIDCAPPVAATDEQYFAASSQEVDKADGFCLLPMPCSLDPGWGIAICCGNGCTVNHSSCAFPGHKTPWGGGPCAGLGNGSPDRGVLCCKDPELL